MCGIIGAFHTGENKERVNELVLNQFEDQKERGTEGFGIVKIQDNMSYSVERATEGFKFMYDIHKNPVNAMICHHRIPTSTPNKMDQTHPILVDNSSLKYKYLVIHNGVIRNDDELISEHEKKGFKYTTFMKDGKFNDSESFAIELSLFIEGKKDEVGTEGSAAFICTQINRETNKIEKIFFGRNEGNPLNMAKTRGKIFISSTGPGEKVAPFKLYSFKIDEELKLEKRKMTFKEVTITNYIQQSTSINQRGLTETSQKQKDLYDWYDTPEATSIEEIMDMTSEGVGLEIDMFMDLTSDPMTLHEISDRDIEETTERIGSILKAMVENLKEVEMEKAQIEAAHTIGY